MLATILFTMLIIAIALAMLSIKIIIKKEVNFLRNTFMTMFIFEKGYSLCVGARSGRTEKEQK